MNTNTNAVVKVLLTGTSGFIGSHCLEYFLEKTDWMMICPCSWQHKGTPERISDIFKRHPEYMDRVRVITHDITVPLTDHTINSFGKVDYIINVASESHVDRSIIHPVPFIQNNVNLAISLLELSRVLKPKLFLQVSTDEVVGTAPEGIEYAEWSPIVPSNPYAASKAAQEAIAISYWRTYNVPLVITNTVNNFGPTQDREKYLARLVSKISKDEKVTVHGSEQYIGGRYYLPVKNHADAILYIINNLPVTMYEDGGRFPDRYNVTSQDEFDNLVVAKKVAQVMGKELNYELVDVHAVRPGHDRRYALDGSKLRNLGWIAPFNFEDSLKEYVEWAINNPQWQ